MGFTITWIHWNRTEDPVPGSIDFYQSLKSDNFLKPRLLPSRCALLIICHNLECSLWVIVEILQLFLPVLTPKPGFQADIWTLCWPIRGGRIFSETLVRGLLSCFCFFVFSLKSLLRGQVWPSFHTSVLFHKGSCFPITSSGAVNEIVL